MRRAMKLATEVTAVLKEAGEADEALLLRRSTSVLEVDRTHANLFRLRIDRLVRPRLAELLLTEHRPERKKRRLPR